MKEVKIRESINNLLARDDISMKDLERATGVNYTSIISWRENNNPKVTPSMLKICRYFKVPLMYLLYGAWKEEFEVEMVAKGCFEKGNI